MQIQNAIITGSFSYNGADLSNVTSSNAYSASLSSRTTDLESTSSVLVGASASFSSILSSVSSSQQQISSSFLTLTASFNAVSASQQQVSASYIALSGSYNTFSGSASTRITVDSASLLQVSSSQQQISSSQQQISSSYIALSGSYNVFSGSASTRTTQIEQVYATTGSNSFRATQSITGSLTVTGQIIAQTLNVQQVTSSIIYSSGSNNFGCDLNSRQTFTGSVLITGSLTIAGASSATSYSGATIYGSTAVCSAVGKFTSCIDAGSGTFSGGVTVTQDINSLYGIAAARNGSNTQASGPYFLLSNAAYNQLWYQQLNASNGLDTWYNGSIKLTIASTGAATFACQVNAESFYTNDTRYISNQIMSGYNANSEDSDIWINYTGYLGGTTRFRDFRIGNGKQGQIALFDGSTGAASFACSVGIGTTLSVTGATSLSCRLSVGASDQSYASIFVGGDITTGANQYAIILDPQLSGTSNSYAVFANARIKANTAVTNAFGIYIPSAEKISGATITNNYALYIANQTSGATLNYSIYSSGGLNYFGGCVGIGINAQTTLFHICQTGQPATPLGLYSTMTLQTDSQANYQRIRFDRDGCAFWGLGVEGDGSSNDFMLSGLVGGKTAGTWSDCVFRIKNSNGFMSMGNKNPQFTIDLSSDDTTRAIQFYGGTGTDKYGIGKFGGSGATTVFHGGAGASNRVSLGCYNGTTYTPNFEVLGNGVICMINIGSGAGTYALKWNSSTKNVTYDTSSERYKNNIRNSIYGLSDIMKLNSKMFEYKDTGRTDIGLIAEEVYPIIPELVLLDENSLPNGVSYDRMVSVLTRGMQEQQCTICSQATMINTLKTCLGIA